MQCDIKSQCRAYKPSPKRYIYHIIQCLWLLVFSHIIIPASIEANAQNNKNANGPPPMLVEVDPVIYQEIKRIVPILGRLITPRKGNVSAEVAGVIENFNVAAGMHVSKGDIIATLRNERVKVERNVAKWELKRAQEKLSSAHIKLEMEKRKKNRLGALRQSGTSTKSSYDDAVSEVERAQNTVSEEEAALEAKKLTLRLYEIDLEKTYIQAPYDGVIIEKKTEKGAYIPVGGALVEMIDDTYWEIEADIPFTLLGGLDIGTEILFSITQDNYKKAKMRAILPTENPLTQTRAVRFVPDLKNNQENLATEQTTTLLIPAQQPKTTLTVHKDAIVRKGNKTIVYVVKDGVGMPYNVLLGAPSKNRFEILDGLQENDLTVIRGNERMQGPKIPVRIKNQGKN